MDKLPTHTTMRIHKVTAKKLRQIYAETGEAQIDIMERLVEAEIQRMNEQRKDQAYYDMLTTGLSKENETLLTVGLPLTCNADSVDVYHYITDVRKLPVNDENFKNVGFAFKKWYKETYPDEYATVETAMFDHWR